MKNSKILLTILLIQPFAGQGMLKNYEDWIVERETKLYKEYANSNYSNDYIFRPLTELHTELDRQVKRNILIKYFATPVVGIVAATLMAIKLVK